MHLAINVESCAISQEKGNEGCCMWKQLLKVPQVDIFSPELNGASPVVAGRNHVFTRPQQIKEGNKDQVTNGLRLY